MGAGSKSSSEPWRVGVLFSQTGITAIIERTQLQGTILAIEEINARGGINGRELRPIICDPGSEERRFAQLADRLLNEDGVTTIFGCYTSSSRKAVLPVVERRNGLLWYPTLYEGFEYSPNVIYTGAAPNQNSVELADYLLRTHGRRFYLIGSDYIYPRESNRIMRELLAQRSGEVVGEHYLDLHARPSEFRLLMRDVRNMRPDAIFSTVVGQATVFLYRAYADAGFDPRIMPIASLTTCEAEVSSMGVDVGQ
jgi:branched-chain amino acid transport system substrate-binding protein